jgi:hypothetical protein
MAYWVMEIEEYQGGTRKARKEFKNVVDYHIHEDNMAREMNHEGVMKLSTLLIGLNPTCSNPNHTDMRVMQRHKRVISVDDFWYTLPDDWNRKSIGKGRWKMDQSYQVAHRNLSDVLGSLIGRSDGETTNCKICSEREPGSTYQIHWQKDPRFTLLPLALNFVVDPHQTVPAEEVISFGGENYTLMSVVFGNGAHFKCNVLFRKTWFHYDGMGITNDNGPKERMVRIDTRDTTDHMTPPAPAEGYNPIAYKYIRTDPKTLDSVIIKDLESVPSDKQFNNMWRLLLTGY